MKQSKKNVVIVIIAAILIIIGIIPKAARFVTTSLNAKNAGYVAIIEPPQISDGADSLELSGELKPYLKTEIFSRINGLVKDRYVQLGERVKKGQILAEIDTPDLDAEAASAKSALISAQKRLMETKYQFDYSAKTYERYKNSSQDGAISAQDLEAKYNSYKTSEMAYEGAKADTEKAKEDLNRLTVLQEYKKVVAPFDGVISKYGVDAGANVVSGGSTTSTSLFEVQQIDKFRVSLFIPQSYAGFVRDGQEVELYIPENPSKKIKGEVSQISAKLDNVSRTMEVVLVIPNDGKSGLYSGMYVKTKLNLKDKQGNVRQKILTVNPACLTTLTTPDQYVAEVNSESKVHYIKVKQGRDFGDRIEILEGLKGREKLITNITDDLKEGQTVKYKTVQ